MFTFDEFWGNLGTNIFRNSSCASNNTRSRLPPRLPLRFLWLGFLTRCKSTVRKVLSKNKIKKNTASALRLASEYASSCTKTLPLGIAFCHKWFLRLPKEKRIYIYIFWATLEALTILTYRKNCGQALTFGIKVSIKFYWLRKFEAASRENLGNLLFEK